MSDIAYIPRYAMTILVQVHFFEVSDDADPVIDSDVTEGNCGTSSSAIASFESAFKTHLFSSGL